MNVTRQGFGCEWEIFEYTQAEFRERLGLQPTTSIATVDVPRTDGTVKVWVRVQ
jgi:hypothetical protein